MIRWGIIGAGNIAHRFAESLSHVEGAELTAISCRTLEKAEAFSREYPCKYIYGDGGKGLLENEEVDAVYISLPHGLHCQWAVKAMKAGKAVLCEKPSVVTEEEMLQIIQTSKETGMLFMEAMKPRFVPVHDLIMQAADKKVIGEIKRIETSLCNQSAARPPGHYLYDPVQGGILLDCGIYCASWIDELTWRSFGQPEIRHTTFRMAEQVESYARCWLLYKDESGEQELRAMLECAFDEKKPAKLTIYGEKGIIEAGRIHRPHKMRACLDYSDENEMENSLESLDTLAREWKGTSSVSEKDNKKTYLFEVPYEVDDFYGQIVHFTQCMEKGMKESPIMPPEASLRCIRLIEQIRKYRPDNSYHGISIQYDHRIVRVRTDRFLLDYLGQKGNDSLELADHIHKSYQARWGEELKISRESLSVEILIHAYLDVVFRRIDLIAEKLGKPGRQLKKTLRFLEDATEVIDCGEREVDSNRFVFDDLVPFRRILYLILGDKA